MQCLRPITVFDTGKVSDETGKRVLAFSAPRDTLRMRTWKQIFVPCGKCQACLNNRRNEWVSRMRLEHFVTPKSTFLTLTYNDANLPLALDKTHVQKFLKRLRQAPRDYGVPPFHLRYFCCGEYGKTTYRPHYHAILFGVDLMEEQWKPYLVGSTLSVRPRYASAVVEKVWPFGFNVVGSTSLASIRYVSKYVSKQFADGEAKRECFVMYSQGLGRGLFVDVKRVGRSVKYDFKSPFHQRYLDGSIVIPEDGRFNLCRNPSVLDCYAERFYPDLYEESKRRRVDYARFKQADLRSPLARQRELVSELRSELRKGVLDNET